MKRTIQTCDLCGQDISSCDIKYKFKKYENCYANFDDFEWTKWTKLDMCVDCYLKLNTFIHRSKIPNSNI